MDQQSRAAWAEAQAAAVEVVVHELQPTSLSELDWYSWQENLPKQLKASQAEVEREQ